MAIVTVKTTGPGVSKFQQMPVLQYYSCCIEIAVIMRIYLNKEFANYFSYASNTQSWCTKVGAFQF